MEGANMAESSSLFSSAYELRVLTMQISISEDKLSLGSVAAAHAARTLRKTLQEQGHARLIAATEHRSLNFWMP